MRQKMSHFIVQWISAAAALVSTSSMACSLVPVDPLLLKKTMAKEIAYRVGVKLEQIHLDAITAPELHRPFELGADCSGFWAYHHISGFRIELESPLFEFNRIGLGNEPTFRGGISKSVHDRLTRLTGRPLNSIFGKVSDITTEASYLAWLRVQADRHHKSTSQYEEDFWGQGYLSPAQVPSYRPNYGQYPVIYRLPPPSLPSSPAQKEKCTYEGVAAILGYGEASPVAVNFINSCDSSGAIEPGEDSSN